MFNMYIHSNIVSISCTYFDQTCTLYTNHKVLDLNNFLSYAVHGHLDSSIYMYKMNSEFVVIIFEYTKGTRSWNLEYFTV